MSEFQIIQETLERAARRRRLERGVRGLFVGLLVGGSIWLLTVGVYKLHDFPPTTFIWAGTIGLTSALLGFLLGFWRKPSLNETARWVDVKQNLRERMSTALEVAETQPPGTWRDLVMHDAASHAQDIEPKKLVPFSFTKAARWAVLILVLAVGLGFVPEYRSKASVQKKEDEKVIKEVGKQVATLTKQEIAQRPPALEQTKKSLEAVSELGERLEKMSLTRSEALKDLASASEKLKDELKQIAKDPALRKMEQAARSPSGRNAETAAGLQKQMDAMQKQLESKAKNPEAIDQLQKEMEKVQEAAKALASKSGQDADAAQQKLSAALSALNQQAAQAGVDLPQIDEAIAALASANTDRFMKEIEAALKDLDKLRDMKQKLDAMQAQAEKLGKDLAEQLKNGQAEAAADTLEKLAEKLKAANLSPEEMNKVLEEVSQALPESKEYGKVEDLLKQACKQGQQGDKQGASQSLADAAKELKDLMQQMNDAAAMMAALENLEQASLCVGQGKGWGQCKMPGNKPGGKNPGNGVGTWGEEGGEWQESYGEGTPYVDRSALNDRNQDGRGLSEREQSDLTDRLSPTKVKGQFSPGGPMPSITLKGVSIKGTSKVAYEEATATAQADAQSALSQDKVPRAYQGAVKDYFDDFKK
jgi:hypothetical protein